MDEPVPEFTSVEGECAFWKAKARELKTELDEFTEDSHQLEKELEIQLKLKDDQLTDLRYKYNRQQHEIDSLQSKLRQCENELLQWEQRHKKEKAEAETLRKHTRELEQKNDDLERAHRIVSESVAEFERMLNREYEKNVMLEVEYEMEKENAQIQLQRLMDEARDLKQELKIQQKQPGAPRTSSSHSRSEDDNQHMDTRDEDGQEEELATKGKERKNEESIGGGEKEDPRKMETDDSPLKFPSPQLVNGTAKKQVNGTESSVVNPIAPPPASSIPSAATLQRESSLKQMERLKNGNSMTASSRSTALAIVADLLRRVNNIDATLKELKRPKSIDDDLCETNDPRDESGGGTMREKAKSPSLIC